MARLLVVDDDAEQLGLRCLLLRTAGHEVTGANSPDAALRIYRAKHPQVVVMDLRLPRVEDGVSLLRDLGPSARVVVLTGALPEDSLPGGPRVLKKPCSSQSLLRTVAELA